MEKKINEERMKSLLILLALFVGSLGSSGQQEPIIGVFTAPSSSEVTDDFLPASYVSWLESAGARVVPIPSGVRWNKSRPEWVVEESHAWTKKEYREIFESINGLLFPGGDPWPIISSDAARLMYKWALDANEGDDYFPIWGTCAGFEVMSCSS